MTQATDVSALMARLRAALSVTEATALQSLLLDTVTRFQQELGNSGTQGETRLRLAGITIKVTTSVETPLERAQNALLKNRSTFC